MISFSMDDSLRTKTIVITGANSGLGYWTTMALAEKGARIFMLCRSMEKGEKARKEIISYTKNSKIELIFVELSSRKSIEIAAQKLLSKVTQIDVLINNAGLVSSERILTEDNIEQTFAVNHLAAVLLTHLLLPSISKAPDGRIVIVSSANHRHAKIHFDDLTLSSKYHILRAYSQSKLANVLFSYELHRLLQQKRMNNVSVYCVDPDQNNTPIGLKTNNWLHYLAWWVRSKMGKSPQKGAECQAYTASEEKIKHMSGKFWKDSKPILSSAKSYDEHDAKKLWDISLQLCDIDEFFSPGL